MDVDPQAIIRMEAKLNGVADKVDDLHLDVRGRPGEDGGIKERVRLLWEDRNDRRWFGKLSMTIAFGAMFTAIGAWIRGEA